MVKNQVNRILTSLFRLEVKRYDPIAKHSYLNEAIDFKKEIIYIGIPKTGSTTVRKQLQQKGRAFIKNPHLDILQVKDLIYPFLLQQNLGKNTTFPNPERVTDIDLRNKAEQIFDSYFKFSGVRNPWARAVSLYHRQEGVQTQREMTFEAFCENHTFASDTCRQPTLHKNQLDWLCDSDGTVLMDYIYKVEEFEQAIFDIKEKTEGQLILNNVRHNVNPNSRSTSYKSYYSDKTKKLIAKAFEKDIDYFKYTF